MCMCTILDVRNYVFMCACVRACVGCAAISNLNCARAWPIRPTVCVFYYRKIFNVRNVHTAPPSVSSLSKKSIRHIHYPMTKGGRFFSG